MKVVHLDTIKNTSRKVEGDGFTSYRFLLASDGLGFSLHKTVIPAGTTRRWHYRHHLEACYCVSGSGIVTDSAGVSWSVEPGTVYAPDDYQPHTFQALEDVTLLCVFNPPLRGAEVHDADGSYPPDGGAA